MKLSPVLLAFWLVLATAVTPVAAAAAGDVSPASAVDGAEQSQVSSAPPDPETDVLGWENGYWHNESIDVDQSDGLSDAELEAFVSRAMARVEYIRGREFEEQVPVSVLSREAYRNRSAQQTRHGEYGEWNNQVWEALFVVGENTDTQDEISSTVGSAVLGFYSPRKDEIRIITDSPDSPTIDNATLVHELVHAMQDQYYNLSSPTYSAPTQDGDLAISGVVEGEANYVETQYRQRCGAEWECVAPAGGGGGSGSGEGPNLGVLLTLLQPYSDGPVYVDRVREREGWAGVEAAFENPPTSSEQTIHLTDERPRDISYADEATNGWEPFPEQGVNGSDTVGEASIYVMFWYQARNYGADTVNPRDLVSAEGEFDLYDYDAPPSNGWANDRLFPYQRETEAGESDAYGYVWVTEWDTASDAREFERAYRAVLSAHDARERSDGVLVVDDGPWADAFRVVRNDTRVTIVNGPTPGDVDDIRPSLATSQPTATTTFDEGEPVTVPGARGADATGDDLTSAAETGASTSGEEVSSTEAQVPGFGLAVGALAFALTALGVLALRRRA